MTAASTPTPKVARPSLARFVILRGLYARSNGAVEAPMIITRVWGENEIDDDLGGYTVNGTAFPDAKMPQPVTSVRLVADAAAADKYAIAYPDGSVAYWPPRV
jgi:hypothetical protein